MYLSTYANVSSVPIIVAQLSAKLVLQVGSVGTLKDILLTVKL